MLSKAVLTFLGVSAVSAINVCVSAAIAQDGSIDSNDPDSKPDQAPIHRVEIPEPKEWQAGDVETFEQAVEAFNTSKERFGDLDILACYGLYKQAMIGDVNIPRPTGWTDFVPFKCFIHE